VTPDLLARLIRRAAPPASFVRSFVLDDIKIRNDGTGRTVEAYAAVFDTSATVSDFEGAGYIEDIARSAFDKTIAERGDRFQVLYNHGLDIYGTPSSDFSKPIGVPIEVRADARGLWTVTRYSSTPLADEILTLIRDGAIREQSFAGRVIRSSVPGPYRRGQRVSRLEIALREYGPTPFPVYADAAILGVRSAATLADEIGAMTADERAELVRLLGTLQPAADGTGDEEPPAPDGEPEPDGATTPTDHTIEIELELAAMRQQLSH
jgi:HK97 family phage prohead protease